MVGRARQGRSSLSAARLPPDRRSALWGGVPLPDNGDVDERDTRVGGRSRMPGAPATAEDDSEGLGPEQVEARRAAGQVNTSPPSPGRTLGETLRANVLTRFNAILGSLLVVVAVVGPPQDGLFGIVLVLNTAIGVAQEVRAKRALRRLAILNAPQARVVRQGRSTTVPVGEIVLDDLIELNAGDQVAVDGEVLRSDLMEIDESLLTGESRSVTKVRGDAVLSGSFVVSGSGRVRATAVGPAAYAAQVEEKARRFSLVRSELQQGTNFILRLVTWVMVGAGVALVLTELLRTQESSADALRGSVAGVAAMVPEGLVLLTSIAFAVGALRLARHRVLVQELPAVEGLARVDVLCIDKTGTLTSGVRLESIVPLSSATPAEIRDVLDALVAADPAPNTTLRALCRGVASGPAWRVAHRVPFSSDRKWSSVTFADHGTWVLGAPDVIKASGARPSARPPEAAVGQRTLLLARSETPIVSPLLPPALAPVAELRLDEELRPDAAQTVEYLLSQGITLKVLSGDAPKTVARIAALAGIPGHGRAGDASRLADDGALGRALAGSGVLGRIAPDQKLAAVRILQQQGHVVAMVGDGVNDVQALKQADLGIAMGSGSQSSRAVARVVLLDNAFSAVPGILDEGRRVIANIERVANLFVTKTVYAALLASVVAITAVPYPFFPRHLTIVSTLTIGVPGFFLAFARGAPRASPGFTRRVLRFTLPAGAAGASATLAAYAVARSWPATTATQARTAAMLAIFAFGIWILGVVARPLNAPKTGLLAAMAIAVSIPLGLPLARRLFDLAVPGPGVLASTFACVAAAVVLLSLWRLAEERRGHP